jgi:hypothetical protein
MGGYVKYQVCLKVRKKVKGKGKKQDTRPKAAFFSRDRVKTKYSVVVMI